MLPAYASAKAATHHHVRNNNNSSSNNNNSSSNNNTSSSNNNTNNNSNHNHNIKRNTSMIFRIEHLLPSAAPTAIAEAAATTTTTTTTAAAAARSAAICASSSSNIVGGGRLAKQQRSGVYVSQRTPKDTLSEAIGTHALIGAAAATLEPPHAMRTYCTLSQRVLCMTPTILRRIKLAEDVPSYNALFELHGSGAGGAVGDGVAQVRVRIIRDIERDEEIVAWFGDELTLLMAIPFLTPLHIQGNSRYTCHLCQLTFETPNPLKVHLAVDCGRHSIDLLWIRLHYAVRAAAAAAAAARQLLPPAATAAPTTTMAMTMSSAAPALAPRFSAFKPIAPAAPPYSLGLSRSPPQAPLHASAPFATSTATFTFLPAAMSTVSLAPLPTPAAVAAAAAAARVAAAPAQPPPQPPRPPQPAPLPAHALHGGGPLNAAAQIEAIVSNMGASKQGHLCIYCGKVYSRKYGLKIHIRTHTGFKPLKCKFCLRPFGDPSNLNKHVRLHLQTTATSNSSSAAANSNADMLNVSAGGGGGGAGGEYTNAADGFKCHLCHKTLARRRDLQRHIESRHHHHHHQQPAATPTPTHSRTHSHTHTHVV